MTKDTIARLHGFIALLVEMLEDELTHLGTSKTKSAITVKKNITATLGKLVTLILQLGKLDREKLCNELSSFSEGDREIINCFLEKYKNK